MENLGKSTGSFSSFFSPVSFLHGEIGDRWHEHEWLWHGLSPYKSIEKSRLSRLSPLARWISKAMTTDKECGSAEVEHILHSEKGAVNAHLILACIVFGAASFVFGYDDKIISPVVALTPFVSFSACSPRMGRLTCTRSRNSKDPIQPPVNMFLRRETRT